MNKVEKLILSKVNYQNKVLDFIKKHFDLNKNKTLVFATSTLFNIEALETKLTTNIINLGRLNNSRFINKFLEEVNKKMPISGLYFGCVETFPNRKKSIMKSYPFFLNHIVYFTDMIVKRVFPKLIITRRIYFYLTKGRNRVISRAETYGRLYSCGFEIVDEESIGNMQYFVVRKIKVPTFDKNPTYGAIIRLKRIGKNRKFFNVYKLRTMHPFSEYLQEYIYKKHNLAKGGKIHDDFRISPEGHVLRKFWLDEIPMFYNLLKGDVKLVGVRPLSNHYFNLYSKELKILRVKHKPGLIPPFYVDLPITLNEIMDSELKYLKAYEKAPLKTDFIYFIKSLSNILIKKARSQ